MPDLCPPPPGLTLGDALRQLPLETPERSAWPALAAQLQRRPRRPRWPWALAAAAALAAVAVLPLRQSGAPTALPMAAEVSSEAGALQALMHESAQLEQLLSALDDPDLASASATLISLQLEDQLGQIDAQLGANDTSSAQRLALWQQRVDLLRDYAGLESTRHWLNSQGERLDGQLVAVF